MHTIKTMPAYDRTSLTMEAPVNVISNGASGNYPRIFSNGENFSIYFAGAGTTAQLYFNGQTPDTRPNFASFRIGTVYAFGSSTINVTFPTTGGKPVKGQYALARFTSGGDLLAGWTVTLNGAADNSAFAAGMNVEVQKDATGLWLKVRTPPTMFIIR